MYLICHVNSQDHLTEGCIADEFIGESSSSPYRHPIKLSGYRDGYRG